MTEPMTLLTDYALGLLALAFGYATLRKNRVDGSTSRSLWACAFLSLSLGALAGGTWHGFQWEESLGDSLWKTTTLSMGFTSLFMTASIVCANCGGKTRRDWLVIVGIKFMCIQRVTSLLIKAIAFACRVASMHIAAGGLHYPFETAKIGWHVVAEINQDIC